MKINGNHLQMEYLFQCKLIDSFLGPASPLILESCDIPVQDYSLARVDEQNEIEDSASDLDLITKTYHARESQIIQEQYVRFRVYAKVQTNVLIFKVLSPLIVVNVFLLFLILNKEEVEYDVLVRLLFVQVYGYKEMRLKVIPNGTFDFIDLANFLTIVGSLIAKFYRTYALGLVSASLTLVGCALLAQRYKCYYLKKDVETVRWREDSRANWDREEEDMHNYFVNMRHVLSWRMREDNGRQE